MFFTIVFRCLHRVKAAEGIRTRKLRWPESNILLSCRTTARSTAKADLWLLCHGHVDLVLSVRRETSRNLLTADDSSISGIRLNTVEAHGYSPPANLSRADWLLLFEGNRTEGRGTQLRVKLGAGKCSRVSEIRARRYSRGMEITKGNPRRKEKERRATEIRRVDFH